jgi:hypothetical protein
VKWLAIGAGVAAFSLAVSGQDALPDWVLRLSRVKHHLRDNFERMPNYVCRENVERFQKSPGRARGVRIDGLQFEVAQVDHKELLALPGAGGFEDKDLSAYISTGILGTGNFSSQPMNLFVADRARFTPHAESADQTVAGPAWDYDIPAFMRGYEIATPGGKFPVGVRGTFWVDADSLDLIRIEEQVVDPPPQTGMSATSSTVRYARAQIGNSSVLLPQSAELTVVRMDGAEMRNEIRFSGCRAYVTESTVHFGDTVEPLPAVKKK